MRIGRLRHLVTIEHKVMTPDGAGGHAAAWVTFAQVWAGVEPLRGQERFEAQKLNGEISHKVIVRYLAGVTPAMRVRFGDRILRQAAPPVNPQERNLSLELLCSEEFEA
jgi:SPP1 family predicted phage head-tail adaptor